MYTLGITIASEVVDVFLRRPLAGDIGCHSEELLELSIGEIRSGLELLDV
jgi:hypothetical protein